MTGHPSSGALTTSAPSHVPPGLLDDRVPAWGPIKFVAKLRHCQQQHAPGASSKPLPAGSRGAGSTGARLGAQLNRAVLLDCAPDDGHYSRQAGYKEAEGLGFLVACIEQRAG